MCRESTTWSLITHFMVDSSPYAGLMEGVRTISLLLRVFAGKTRLAWLYKT
jgi:hypothetical protein